MIKNGADSCNYRPLSELFLMSMTNPATPPRYTIVITANLIIVLVLSRLFISSVFIITYKAFRASSKENPRG